MFNNKGFSPLMIVIGGLALLLITFFSLYKLNILNFLPRNLIYNDPNCHSDNLTPMYGYNGDEKKRYEDCPHLVKVDEDFINSSEKTANGDRKKASDDFAEKGLGYMRKGDFDTGIKRLNQAWLLDKDNAKVYHNFGLFWVIKKKDIDQSTAMFQKSLSIDSEQAIVICDLAYNYYLNALNEQDTAKRSEYLKLSVENNVKSDKLDSSNAQCHYNWAATLYEQGNYPETWKQVKIAQDLGFKAPTEFINKLSSKMTDPEK